MKAVVQKKPAENHKLQSSLANHRSAKQPTFSTLFLSNDKILIQRKPICPCDGGCPCCARVIQPKLTIGQPNDKYEQEADRVADQVMRMPEPKVQRQAVPEEELEDEEEENIQAKGKTGNTPTVIPQIAANINALRGSGQSVPESVRAFFEPRFGVDFSGVRVHTDSNAVQMNRELKAQAFTHGRDIYFGTGKYNLGTTSGKRLLAHELTHVVQQNKTLCGRTLLTTLAALGIQRTPYSQKITRRKGTLFEKTVNGIQVRFFLYTGEIGKESQILSQLSTVTSQIKKMNRMMAEPAYKVHQLFIWTAAITGFRIVLGKPVLYIDTQSLIKKGLESVTHEMGHAVAYSYIQGYKPTSGRKKRKLAPKNVIEMIADVFLQLRKTTKKKLLDLGVKDRTTKSLVVPVGLFMVDPWNWCSLPKSKCKTEHPWDGFDEFFASAFSGYLLNVKGLRISISKYEKMDAKIKPWGRKLLLLLKAFRKGRIPRRWYTIVSTSKAIKSHIAATVGRTPEIRKRISSGKPQYVYISRPGAPMTIRLTPPLIWLVDPNVLKAIKVYIPTPSYRYRPTRPGY